MLGSGPPESPHRSEKTLEMSQDGAAHELCRIRLHNIFKKIPDSPNQSLNLGSIEDDLANSTNSLVDDWLGLGLGVWDQGLTILSPHPKLLKSQGQCH